MTAPRPSRRRGENSSTDSPVDLARLIREFPFPDPELAEPDGLLAYGGDLSAERLLAAYAQGIFPWYESGPILWFSPNPRAVLDPAQLHTGRSLRKSLRRDSFDVRLDTSFERVIRRCAETPRADQDGTWITPDMIDAYCRLFDLGYAHCAEAWSGDELVGGLYGVSLGAAYFGESMFADRTDASKVAFVHLVEKLRAWNFRLIDCQIHTDHLARFGAEPWSRARFLRELSRALEQPTRIGRWRLED